jgi:hypothetical protein
MKTFILFVLSSMALVAGPLPDPKPIITADELRTAAAEAPVIKIDLSLPEKDAEVSLAKRFFKQPEERRYTGITTADWSKKWDLFAGSLISKANQTGLDWQSLEKCLRALNKGRNEQTMCGPIEPDATILPGSPEDNENFRKKAEKEYQEALKDKEKNPEKYYDKHLAIIPVGAYLAKYSKGECWIIVCKFGFLSEGETSPAGLGGIMIWALDTRSTTVVVYTGSECDCKD